MLLSAMVLIAVLWMMPLTRSALLPVVYLNTHLHEFFHALGALLTGGSVEHILVLSDGSGVTPVAGGDILVVASAGYTGASILGAVLIFFSRTIRSAKISLIFLGSTLLANLLMFVRGDGTGFAMGAAWGIATLLIGWKVKSWVAPFAAQLIGILLCLASLQSLFVLLGVSVSANAHSDALVMQNASGVPAIFWAVAWCAVSITAVVFTLKRAWTIPPNSRDDKSGSEP